MIRPTVARVDLAAIEYNFASISTFLSSSAASTPAHRPSAIGHRSSDSERRAPDSERQAAPRVIAEGLKP